MDLKLNGWQRLWVVLLAMYAVPVSLIAVESWPQADAHATARLYESLDLVGKHMESTTPGYSFEGSYSVRQKYYSDLTDDQIIERLHAKFGDKISFDRIELNYLRKLRDLPKERFELVAYGFAAWLLPALAAYLLGASMGWVRRGFRRNDT
jgi:hypothetical protein